MAPENGMSPVDLSKLLDSFQPLTRKAEPQYNPKAGPAVLKIGFPALSYSTANTVHMCRVAAQDRGVHPNFPAMRVRFSDQAQGLLLVPEAVFNSQDPELYTVHWSADEHRFTIDLSESLVHKHWGTPAGYFRWANVSLHRNVPTYTTALFVDLKGSSLKVRKKKKDAEKEGAEASNKAAAKPEAAKPQAKAPETPQQDPPKAS